MSSIILTGDTSGTVSIAAPAVAGTNTMTLAAGTGTLAPRVFSTAVASTSGTSIDFINIPAWVTRVTVMFNGVSTNGTAIVIIQLGTASGFTTSGYNSAGGLVLSGPGATNTTSGLGTGASGSAAALRNGAYIITNVTGNTWAMFGNAARSDTAAVDVGAGTIALAAALTQIRITTVGGTDTFDAGSINIMYE